MQGQKIEFMHAAIASAHLLHGMGAELDSETKFAFEWIGGTPPEEAGNPGNFQLMSYFPLHE